MNLIAEVTCGAILGVAAGATSGAICGGIAAYVEGYISPFARMFDHAGRTLIAKSSVCNGRAIGGLAGLIIGGIAGGIGTLFAGFVAWVWVGSALASWLRRGTDDHIIGAAWGIFAGGLSAAFAGYGGRLIVNVM